MLAIAQATCLVATVMEVRGAILARVSRNLPDCPPHVSKKLPLSGRLKGQLQVLLRQVVLSNHTLSPTVRALM